jgi:hypothetical protein
VEYRLNLLNAELNPICHLLALAGAHHFVDVSRIRVKEGVLYFIDIVRFDSVRVNSTDFSRGYPVVL